MGKIPGHEPDGRRISSGVDADGEIKRIQGIIDSMTPRRAEPTPT